MKEYEYKTVNRVQGNPMSEDEIENLRKEGWDQAYEPISPTKLPADIPRSVYVFKRKKQN